LVHRFLKRRSDRTLRYLNKGWLESLGVKLIPHGSQGRLEYVSGDALASGSFWDHLLGNERCLRDWWA
jgi:hypothetical protein